MQVDRVNYEEYANGNKQNARGKSGIRAILLIYHNLKLRMWKMLTFIN